MSDRYLADTSVLILRRRPPVSDWLSVLIAEGLVSVCGVVELELGRGARNRRDHDEFRSLCAALPRAFTGDDAFRRAFDVQANLADTGRHRVSLEDLLIAATAEAAGRTLLHYDSDFERIAEVTGQPHRWIAPRGSL